MARLRLRPLPSYPYSCEIAVRTTDLNYGGHLGNDRLLALIHEARVGFLAARGWTELDCGGASLIMADAAIVYEGEAFAGDMLRIEVAVGSPTGTGFRLYHRVTRPRDAAAIAVVETGMVCFDYRERRPRALPEAVRAACTAVEPGG
jgi:acyl-CoA thioesterase FadM